MNSKIIIKNAAYLTSLGRRAKGETTPKVAKIITNFLAQKPQKIGKIDSLAVALARPAVYIKDGIEEELKNQIIEKSGQLWSIYQTFRGNLIKADFSLSHSFGTLKNPSSISNY